MLLATQRTISTLFQALGKNHISTRGTFSQAVGKNHTYMGNFLLGSGEELYLHREPFSGSVKDPYIHVNLLLCSGKLLYLHISKQWERIKDTWGTFSQAVENNYIYTGRVGENHISIYPELTAFRGKGIMITL